MNINTTKDDIIKALNEFASKLTAFPDLVYHNEEYITMSSVNTMLNEFVNENWGG